jgi:hypothetical protein
MIVNTNLLIDLRLILAFNLAQAKTKAHWGWIKWGLA